MRAIFRLAAFTEFANGGKGFWNRPTRCAGKPEARGIPTNENVFFSRAIRALRVPGGQLPLALSAIVTRPCNFHTSGHRGIAIRMYETRLTAGDESEGFSPNVTPESPPRNNYLAPVGDGCDEYREGEEEDSAGGSDGATEGDMGDGSIYLVRPKKPVKHRNFPGGRYAFRRGAVANFGNIPNRRRKWRNRPVRIRLGDPSRQWRARPFPLREKSDAMFPTKGIEKHPHSMKYMR